MSLIRTCAKYLVSVVLSFLFNSAGFQIHAASEISTGVLSCEVTAWNRDFFQQVHAMVN